MSPGGVRYRAPDGANNLQPPSLLESKETSFKNAGSIGGLLPGQSLIPIGGQIRTGLTGARRPKLGHY